MNDWTVVANLTSEEWGVVSGLRVLPQGGLRAEFVDLLRETLAFAAAPACSEAQADGVPCPSPHTSCDQCERVLHGLSRLRQLVVPPAG